MNDDDVVWVLGYIDAYSAVHARQITMRQSVYGCGSMHNDQERLSGRAWRWNVINQEFGAVLTGGDRLDEDDRFRVLDYLDSGGYVKNLPGILEWLRRCSAAERRRG